MPFLQGVFLEDVALTTSTVAVAHRLGREPRGYFVMAKTGPGDLWLSQAPDSRNLYFLSDSTLTVDLWVF